MKLSELKQEVYGCWECLSDFNNALIQPENFKPEVRSFGDLRYKKTWQKAYAAFFAKLNWDSGITNHTAIVHVFNFTPERWDYNLREEIIEQYLSIPGALEFIIEGLEEIYRSNNLEEHQCANVFLKVASQKSGGTSRSITTRFVRQLSKVDQLRAS